MLKCPFCGSNDIQYLSSNDSIFKNYVKEKQLGMSYSTKTGTYIYPISKGLCLKCGYVFQKMEDEILEKYHEEKQFFRD